jgi:hypothetical protein
VLRLFAKRINRSTARKEWPSRLEQQNEQQHIVPAAVQHINRSRERMGVLDRDVPSSASGDSGTRT